MRHVFVATKLGWDKDREGVWFDSGKYTKEQAEAEFKPYQGISLKGYPYTGYEYDGQKYYSFKYIGEFEDNKMPLSDNDILNFLAEGSHGDSSL